MRVPAQKVELLVSKDTMSYSIGAVNLRIDEKSVGRGKSKRMERTAVLEATDSYRALTVPVEVSDDDTPGLIHPLALTTARKEKVEEIRANGSTVVPVNGGQLELHRPHGTFPKLPEILTFDGDPVFTIGLNAELLAGIAKALGAKDSGLRLEFFGPLKPMRVTFDGAPGCVGALMPVRRL